MKLPLQITFRDVAPSEAIETQIREKAEKLDLFSDKVLSCRVTVEAPHRHHNKGKLYHVTIDMSVPGAELVANREPDKAKAHADVHVAIRDAFDAARRQLQNYARRTRGEVKTHRVAPDSGETDL